MAAGLCAGAVGTDTAGSIRIPAAYLGVVGLKPSYGLVSRHCVTPLSWSFDHVGPMARRVGDTALLLQAMAGRDPADGTSASVAGPDYRAGLGGSIRRIKIGVPRAFVRSTSGIDPAVLQAFDGSLVTLDDLGAEVRPVRLTAVRHAETVRSTILLTEALTYHRWWLQHETRWYAPGTRERLLPGIFYSGADYVLAQRGRAIIQRMLDDVLRSVDVIATPTTTSTAPPFARYMSPRTGTSRSSHLRFTELFNLSGLPSLSVPCGFDRHGLPVGLMLSGRLHEEALLLRVGYAYERATRWHLRRPRLHGCAH